MLKVNLRILLISVFSLLNILYLISIYFKMKRTKIIHIYFLFTLYILSYTSISAQYIIPLKKDINTGLNLIKN